MIDDSEVVRIGDDKVAVPDGTYKVIAWEDTSDNFNVRAYMIRQNDTDMNLTNYLRSVDEVEDTTGLDFFPELDATLQGTLEANVPSTLW